MVCVLKRDLNAHFVSGHSESVNSAARRLKEIGQWEETCARLSAYIERSDHDLQKAGCIPMEISGEVVRKGLILVRDDQVHQCCKAPFPVQTGLQRMVPEKNCMALSWHRD